MSYSKPRVVIAGLRGGTGKTTLSLGLTKAFRDRGLAVVPFKKGPDYIDAGWLARASGRNCYNLDPFLVPGGKILQSFFVHTEGADISILEGNRGLFDGMDAGGTYSTSELAKLLKTPVILIADCTKVTRTLAAMIKGVISFDSDLNIGGVVLNQVFGRRHERVIREAIEGYTPARVIGVLGRERQDLITERHMGLTPYHEYFEIDSVIERIGRMVADGVDLKKVLDIARSAPVIEIDKVAGLYSSYKKPGMGLAGEDLKIGVIRDMAFQFYYPENIEALRANGVMVVEMSAIEEGRVPDIDALYIGGGFPETNALRLSGNRGFVSSLKDTIEEGLPVYAECGGLMYLGEELEYDEKRYPMAGVLPIGFKMEKTPVAHGYTIATVTGENPYFRVGTELRGHEFHYSRVMGLGNGLRAVFRMKRGSGITDGLDGIVYKNVLATYTHLHALGSPEWVSGMIGAAAGFRLFRRSGAIDDEG